MLGSTYCVRAFADVPVLCRVRRTSEACELRFCGRRWRGAALLYRRVAMVILCVCQQDVSERTRCAFVAELSAAAPV